MNIADACCRGRLVMTLEGGYNIQGQTEAVKMVLREMRDETRSETDEPCLIGKDVGSENPLIRRVIEQITPYWPVF
jgi:acetoin utilization deacetylase AcuC-like enzyme